MQTRESDGTSADVVDLLGRRYDFLAVLDIETYDKRGLQERLDVSRSTVDRAVRELQASNLVVRTDTGYRTTLYGYTLLAVYESILDNIERVRRAKTILAILPPDVDFTFDMLVNADVHLRDESAPHVPSTRLLEQVERASSIKVLAYAQTDPEANNVFYNQIANGKTDAEVIFRREMYSYLESTYSDQMQRLLEKDRCRMYVADGIPYGLYVLTVGDTEHAALAVYGTNNVLRGLIINDDPKVVSWANDVFDNYREAATRLDTVSPPKSGPVDGEPN